MKHGHFRDISWLTNANLNRFSRKKNLEQQIITTAQNIMSKQPPNNNNDNQFDSDLEAIENAMNSIMQGALSSMFRQLIDPSIFENAENNRFPGIENSGNSITTVFDGRNINSRVPASTVVEEDGYGGSDFKRLAKKSRENRGITPAEDVVSSHHPAETTTTTSPAGMIFNLLFQQPPAEIFNRKSSDALPAVSLPDSSGNNQPKDEVSWIFTNMNSTNSKLHCIRIMVVGHSLRHPQEQYISRMERKKRLLQRN